MSPELGGGSAQPRRATPSALVLGYSPAGFRTARDLADAGVAVDHVGTPPDPDQPLPAIVDLALAPGLATPSGRADLSPQARGWIAQTRLELPRLIAAGDAYAAALDLHHHRDPRWAPPWSNETSGRPEQPSPIAGQRWTLRSSTTVLDSVAVTDRLRSEARTAGVRVRQSPIRDLADLHALCNEKHFDIVVDAMDLEGPELFGSRECLYDIRFVDRYVNDEYATGRPRAVMTDGDVAAVIVGPRHTWVTNRIAELQVDRLAIAELDPHDMVDAALDHSRELRPDLHAWFAANTPTRYLWTTSSNAFGPRIHFDERTDDLPPIAHLWFMGADAASMFLGAGSDLARQVLVYLREGSVDEGASGRSSQR